jgi:RNA polymerase sigma-70 factor (ECF subfamily)
LLIERAQAGDPCAFAALVDRYWAGIRRWLHGLTGGRHESEDLTQETFLRAWRHLPAFAAGTNFRAWLYRIARNCLFDSRKGVGPAQALPHAELIPGRDPGPVGMLIGQETQAQVAAAIAGLPPPFREPFLLRTQEELSYAEIAQVLDVTEATVRWRVHKARRLLLRELGPKLDRGT